MEQTQIKNNVFNDLCSDLISNKVSKVSAIVHAKTVTLFKCAIVFNTYCVCVVQYNANWNLRVSS